MNTEQPLVDGCYLISYRPKLTDPPPDTRLYQGTLRVLNLKENGEILTVDEFEDLVAAKKLRHQKLALHATGDLYRSAETYEDPGTAMEPNIIGLTDDQFIPIFPVCAYRYFLRVRSLIPNTPRKGSITLTLDVHRFGADERWGNPRRVEAVLYQSRAGEASDEVSLGATKEKKLPHCNRAALVASKTRKLHPYEFTGKVYDPATGALVGRMELQWICEYIRYAKASIFTVAARGVKPAIQAPRIPDNAFEQSGWLINENYPAPIEVDEERADENYEWSMHEIHSELNDHSAIRDLVWDYRLLCVPQIEGFSRGVMFDSYGSDDGEIHAEASAIAALEEFKDERQWGISRGEKLQDEPAAYSRVAVHELGHAMGLQHNFSDLGYMATSDFIADQGLERSEKYSGKAIGAFTRDVITTSVDTNIKEKYVKWLKKVFDLTPSDQRNHILTTCKPETIDQLNREINALLSEEQSPTTRSVGTSLLLTDDLIDQLGFKKPTDFLESLKQLRQSLRIASLVGAPEWFANIFAKNEDTIGPLPEEACTHLISYRVHIVSFFDHISKSFDSSYMTDLQIFVGKIREEGGKRFPDLKSPNFRELIDSELGELEADSISNVPGKFKKEIDASDLKVPIEPNVRRSTALVSKLLLSKASASEFPQNIVPSFSLDDINRLRFFPDIVVRPGGAYESVGPYRPYRDVYRANGLSLSATPLIESVPYGAPVRVVVKLTNDSPVPQRVPTRFSLSGGHLDGNVLAPNSNTSRSFWPLKHSPDADATNELEPGESIFHSMTLIQGYQGALFPTAGDHRVTVFASWRQIGKRVYTEARCNVRITPPIDERHRIAAHRILNDEKVLQVLALRIPSDETIRHLQDAHDNCPVLRPHYHHILLSYFARHDEVEFAALAEDLADTDILSFDEIRSFASCIASDDDDAFGNTRNVLRTMLNATRILESVDRKEIRDQLGQIPEFEEADNRF